MSGPNVAEAGVSGPSVVEAGVSGPNVVGAGFSRPGYRIVNTISTISCSRNTHARNGTSVPAAGCPAMRKMNSAKAISRSVGDGSGALRGCE